MQTFDFYRFRFLFRALDSVLFPPGQSGNIVRGAFGKILRQVASPDNYAFLFEPGAPSAARSRVADWPRPFVLRCSHLDGSTLEPGETFFLDAHIFELRRPLLPCFRAVFERFAAEGIGPGRGRAEVTAAQQLDPADNPMAGSTPSSVALVGDSAAVPAVTLGFVTPTELKTRGRVADRPEFDVLFARLCERFNTLGELYGNGPLDADCRALVERAGAICLTRCDLTWEYASRKSTRTGQTHPLGGLCGEADYEGELGEFLPWLRAMRWVGVGRQTVWGKGDVRVVAS
ncbi:MAG TPA: CRISPR system precrRNA processing endoribonuclease RAMP protein Cas6 [Bryobacteraceae bacterium]|nr:CRISPR system precrRNA processing endoribonuclease RAMP protein Cas6 [Bryobacteraceae bacterium]